MGAIILKYGHTITWCVCFFTLSFVVYGEEPETLQGFKHLFEENKGQFRDMNGDAVPNVLFKASYGNLDIYLTQQGLTYCSSKHEAKGDSPEAGFLLHWERVDMLLEGANIKPENIVKDKTSSSKRHYYINAPITHTHTNSSVDRIRDVESCEQVTIREVYPGVDWVVYSRGSRGLKYDFVVHEGADASVIKLKYKSRLPIEIAREGTLVMTTEHGKIEEGAPISFQEEVPVRSRFKKQKATRTKSSDGYITEVGYRLGKYNHQKSLTIDPELQWSTLMGGDRTDHVFSLETDQQNNLFMVVSTHSSNFPVQNNGTYFRDTITGSSDPVLMKFSDEGVLLWSTRFGGTGFEEFRGLTIDAQGNLITTGATTSSDFPVWNSHQSSLLGLSDAVLAKFDNDGELLWSTYLGGDERENSESVAIDSSGNIYVCGFTTSGNFPIQGATPFKSSIDSQDVYLARFTPNGILEWSTFYGGIGHEHYARIAYGAGKVFLAAETRSSNLAIHNGMQTIYGGGPGDIYIAGFDVSGNRIWDSYLGGNDEDVPLSMEVDHAGDLYLFGVTMSNNFPTTPNAFEPNAPGLGDAFLTKMDEDGNIIWSTYMGGWDRGEFLPNLRTSINSLAIDACDNVYVNYRTLSPTLETGSNCFNTYLDTSYNTIVNDFLSRFTSSGEVLWRTYFGGSHGHHHTIDVDNRGVLYLAGSGSQTTQPFVHLDGAFNDTLQDGFSEELFLARFGNSISYDSSIMDVTCPFTCDGSVSFTVNGGCPPYSFEFQGQTITGDTNTITLTSLCAGSYSITATSLCGEPNTISFTIEQGMVHEVQESITLCQGDSVYLRGEYQHVAGTYVDTVSCDSIITYEVTVQPYADATINTLSNNYCYENNILQLSVVEQGGRWSGNGITDPTAGLFSIADAGVGDHELIYTIDGNCPDADTITLSVINLPEIDVVAPAFDCDHVVGWIQVVITSPDKPVYNYSWNTGDTLPLIEGLVPGTYTVRVSDNVGCYVDTVIELEPFEGRCGPIYVHVPNSFTPNGDGENDEFKPVFNDVNLLNYHLQIYASWGELVFDSQRVDKAWDGNYQGDPVQLGIYNYTLHYGYEENGREYQEQHRGVVHVLN